MTEEETQVADDAVRDYLRFLADPSALVDQSAKDRLTARLEGETDPLERLRLVSAIRQAAVVDGESLRAAFVKHAADLARREGIAVEAFAEMGVPREDLRAAGLLPSSKGSKSSRRGRPRSAQPVGREAVLSLVPEGPFTLKTLERLSGASPLTVRRAVEGLVEGGELTALGPDPEHSGRGRAPNLFSRAGSTSAAEAASSKRAPAKRAPAKRAPAKRAPAKRTTTARSGRKKSGTAK